MKGSFSALAVKRIREKSKNDPPYSTSQEIRVSAILKKMPSWNLETLKQFKNSDFGIKIRFARETKKYCDLQIHIHLFFQNS
jgi:hypothetical protein